jgi:hypothetical protein
MVMPDNAFHANAFDERIRFAGPEAARARMRIKVVVSWS